MTNASPGCAPGERRVSISVSVTFAVGGSFRPFVVYGCESELRSENHIEVLLSFGSKRYAERVELVSLSDRLAVHSGRLCEKSRLVRI